MADLSSLGRRSCRIIYIGESLRQHPISSSEILETIAGIGVIIGFCGLVYAALILGCAVDNSCAAIFMEPVR